MIKQLSEQQIRQRQNIVGATFVGLYVLNFIMLLLKYMGWVSPACTWYIYAFGVIATVCYFVLFKMSSNAMAEIFAGCQVGITAFFSVMLPIVQGADSDARYSGTVTLICVLFTVLSIYLWTILMHNCRFTREQIRWIIFLPMPFLINIATYYSTFQTLIGSSNTLLGWNDQNDMSHFVTWLLMLFSASGLWHLCHAECFAARTDDYTFPTWSPFNRYTMAFAIAIIAIFIIF